MGELTTEVFERRPRELADSRTTPAEELKAFNAIVSAVGRLEEDARTRVITSALTFLGMAPASHRAPDYPPGSRGPSDAPHDGFSEDRTISPKEFMLDKKPRMDVDRIACLAYYLTHYRDTPHFKTLDLSKLNTEAAQVKFSNAAKAVNNAASAGLLVPAGSGKKQISAIGELYVQALPDREAARAAIAYAKRRRKGRRAAGIVEAKS
jgi:hypothetical protein